MLLQINSKSQAIHHNIYLNQTKKRLIKKTIISFLTLVLLFAYTKASNAQQIIKTDKEIYSIDGAYYFTITKTDINTKKVLFKAETKIPDKSKKEAYTVGYNDTYFELVG